MAEILPDSSQELLTSRRIETNRKNRKIEVFITDYSPDDKSFQYQERVAYYHLLIDQLGVSSIRTEFRLKDLLNRDGSINETTISRYRDSLRAMKEAGLEAPTIVLFTPSDWMNNLVRSDQSRMVQLYESCVKRTVQLCSETEVPPARIQVMNEVNTKLQTKHGIDHTVNLIRKTAEIVKPIFPETKVITTVLTVPEKGWQNFTKNLLIKAGDNLDGIGFDYYPGTYENPPIKILGKRVGKSPYESFAGITPYLWLAEQKMNGILKDKEVILAEIGAPAIFQKSILGIGYDYRQQQYGLDRIVQALDHFPDLKIFSAIGFFVAGKVKEVDTKFPGGLDFFPWTLIRRDKDGRWQLTEAGKRLKHLISTRLNTAKG